VAGDAVAMTVLTTVIVRVAVDLISGFELVDRTAVLHAGDIVETRPPAFGIGDTVNDPIGP
jgi:ABC-type dipeptide/oligopeptide/nickel transport system ATPase component